MTNNDWDIEYIENLKEFDKHIKESELTLNYDFIMEKYFEIYEVTLNNGSIMPYRFNTIGLAYRGHDHDHPTKFKNFNKQTRKRLTENYAKRSKLQKKYSNPESDQILKYKEFLDKEILDFIKEFPQYKNVIIEK